MSPADDLAAVSAALPPFKPLPQKAPDVSIDKTADGTYYVRSNHPPAQARGRSPTCWPSGRRPIRTALHPAARAWAWALGGCHLWRGQARRRRIAQWLLDQGLGAQDSVMVLSANSVEHALVMLGCYTAGVPIAPISPAYSLISSDHAKLKHCSRPSGRGWCSPSPARCSPGPSRPSRAWIPR